MVLQNHESRTNSLSIAPLCRWEKGWDCSRYHPESEWSKKILLGGGLVVGCHGKLGGFQNLEQSLNRSIAVQSRNLPMKNATLFLPSP